jgi:hypothetical protein
MQREKVLRCERRDRTKWLVKAQGNSQTFFCADSKIKPHAGVILHSQNDVRV